ncbi:DUF4192 domain-containing protein [Nocardia uniformis]|uniref:DUF4192 domain-containing protein n=1 Tax=Nocardia uniformis TaxID=53432 RepID=A0A849C0U7_9NOCA|nr:DUF4192 domain-containing protein [Nocardia uniformis]NNH71086.1 DUF4192 domain-containing protein [Nocardia uniformis]
MTTPTEPIPPQPDTALGFTRHGGCHAPSDPGCYGARALSNDRGHPPRGGSASDSGGPPELPASGRPEPSPGLAWGSGGAAARSATDRGVADRSAAAPPPPVGNPLAGAGFDALAGDSVVVRPQHLHEPGGFIVAVPAMLGFTPVRSLVVAVLRAAPGVAGMTAVDVVARLDFDSPGRIETGQVVERVAGICVRHNAVAVLALIVDDRATAPTAHHRGVRGRRHRELVEALERRLAAETVPLAGAWAVAGIAPELMWWSLLEPRRTGTQPDPAASLITLGHVLDGRPVRGSREELTAVVEVDAVELAAVAQVFDAAVAAAQQRLAAAVRRGESGSYSRAALRKVLWQIANVESGAELEASELAELAVALRDPAVRDVMFALAPGDHAIAAEALWVRLTRCLPDPDRAETAALLGYSAYARGDGSLAGVALRAALASDPEHTMAQLLDTALQSGMRPEQLCQLAATGRDTAADLGVDLGGEQS